LPWDDKLEITNSSRHQVEHD